MAVVVAAGMVTDRLHFHYHKSCREVDSPYYVEGFDANDFPSLKGVDIEAAEQLFSVSRR